MNHSTIQTGLAGYSLTRGIPCVLQPATKRRLDFVCFDQSERSDFLLEDNWSWLILYWAAEKKQLLYQAIVRR